MRLVVIGFWLRFVLFGRLGEEFSRDFERKGGKDGVWFSDYRD